MKAWSRRLTLDEYLLLYLLLGLLLTFIPVRASGQHNDAIPWKDYETALKEAQRRNRPLFLYFYVNGCGFCRLMDTRTFSSKRVAEYLRDFFVSSRINAFAYPHLARRYMVRGFPTSWFLTPEGKAILFIPGYLDTETFSKVLRYIVGGHYKSESLREYLRSSKF